MQASCTLAPARVSSREEAKCRAEGSVSAREWEAARPRCASCRLLGRAGRGQHHVEPARPTAPRPAAGAHLGGEPMTDAGGVGLLPALWRLRMAWVRLTLLERSRLPVSSATAQGETPEHK